jgi:hypothetical protein
MFRVNWTYRRVVIGIWSALALIMTSAMPVSAQVTQNNLNSAIQSTVSGASATATGGTAVGTGIGTGGAATSDQSQTSVNENKNKNENENALSNNPSQTVISNSVPNLIQLPGFAPAYPNFTQPYLPSTFINGAGPVRPIAMTYAQASDCNGSSKSDDKRSIKLYYPAWDKVAPAANFSGYVGAVRVEEKDGQWIEAVCSAARKAMDKGADEGVVEFVIRPVNRTWGFGGSASFGGSGMPAGGANPYALAGAVGLGMGVSGSYVKGELMLSITGFKSGSVRSARIEEKETTTPLKPVSFTPAPERATPTLAVQGN